MKRPLFRTHSQVLRVAMAVFVVGMGAFVAGLVLFLVTESDLAFWLGMGSFVVGMVLTSVIMRYAQRRSLREFNEGMEQIRRNVDPDNDWWGKP